MISRHPIFTGFRRLTCFQRDPWDRGVTKEWQLWTKLVGKETGLGWDNSKHTIEESEERWEAKIKVISYLY